MQKRDELSGRSWMVNGGIRQLAITEGNLLPEGKTSFSLTMTCRRRGAARNTLPCKYNMLAPRVTEGADPKKATERLAALHYKTSGVLTSQTP